jgi:hypothetical protein
MKALSLTQPWASLVAIGAKQIETRSWRTEHRGRIAIHAAKGFPCSCRALCGQPPFVDHLQQDARFMFDGGMLVYKAGLPLGAIVAIAYIVGCRATHEVSGHLSDEEEMFGDYGPDRWAWLLSDVRRLPEPIPCKGALGLWTVPEDIAQYLEAV